LHPQAASRFRRIATTIKCTEDHLAGLRDREGGGAKVSSQSSNHFDHEEAKMMYSGIDLHSNNSVIAVIDDADHIVAQKRLPNEISKIIGFLARWRDEMAGVVVESTYNWYWLIDGLQDAGFQVHLANTSAIKQYEGLKHSGDETDAQHLAHLLRLGILPTGTILPREHRAVRDLARKRMQLVQSCTAHVLAVENIMARQLGGRMTSNQIKRLTDDAIDSLSLTADVSLAIKANVAVIATLQSQIEVLEKRLQERKSTPRRAMDPARVRLYAVVRRSGRLRDVVQDEQVRSLAGRDRVGATLVVAEFHEQRLVIKLLDDSADLPACKPLRGKVRQQCHHVQSGRPFVLCALFRLHHSTQQVTNLGTLSPVRTIQIVLTTALFPCRLMVASRRQCVPQGFTAIGEASLERAASSRASHSHDASLR